MLLPVLLALVLCAPGAGFPFLFDDYDFLSRAQTLTWAELLPDPDVIFYRPVSREAYFALLSALGRQSWVGHTLNFGLLAAAILLLDAVTRRLLGRGPAVMAALCFAAIGPLPLLVSWISGCQDLLALDFVLLALLLQVERRTVPALAAAGLALLSKEVAVAAFPALALSGWIVGGNRRASLAAMAGYLALAAIWLAIHPATHILAGRRFMGAEAGYIGLDNPGRWVSLARGLLTLVNIPSSRPAPEWLGHLWAPLLLSLVAVTVAWNRLPGASGPSRPPGAVRARIAWLGVLLALPPLVLTSILVRHWAPYYVVLPAAGSCMSLAALLTGFPRRVTAVLLCAFLVLGAATRAMVVQPGIPSEPNLDRASRALDTVEKRFLLLQPRIEVRDQVLVYVLGYDRLSVRTHVYRFKAPRWWYNEPALAVSPPDQRRESQGRDFLFWVSPDLAVHEVDQATLLPRSLGGRADYVEYQRTLRAYARGLADSGQLDRAVKILLGMPQLREEYRNLDHRIAAMLLVKHGRAGDAERILAGLPPFPHKSAVEMVVTYLLKTGTTPIPVEAAMLAFGLRPDDPRVLREIVRALRYQGGYAPAALIAQRLLEADPSDEEARAAVADGSRRATSDLLTEMSP